MKKAIFLRDSYNYDSDKASNDAGVVFKEPSLVEVHHAPALNINTIVARYMAGHPIPLRSDIPLSEDFVGVTDYHTSLNLIKRAEGAFNAFPAHVREKFQNDPGQFLDFVSDPENEDETRKLFGVKPRTAQNLSTTDLAQPPAEGTVSPT